MLKQIIIMTKCSVQVVHVCLIATLRKGRIQKLSVIRFVWCCITQGQLYCVLCFSHFLQLMQYSVSLSLCVFVGVNCVYICVYTHINTHTYTGVCVCVVTSITCIQVWCSCVQIPHKVEIYVYQFTWAPRYTQPNLGTRKGSGK